MDVFAKKKICPSPFLYFYNAVNTTTTIYYISTWVFDKFRSIYLLYSNRWVSKAIYLGHNRYPMYNNCLIVFFVR